MKTLRHVKVLILFFGIFFSIPAFCQTDEVTLLLNELSSAINSDDEDLIDEHFYNLTRYLRKIDDKEEKVNRMLECLDQMILMYPEDLVAHDLIYELLRITKKHDRRDEFTYDIIKRVKAFNLLLYDTEMIEQNVAFAERIDRENAESLASYLRNNSKINLRIQKVNAEKKAIDLTLQEVKDEFQTIFNQTMDSLQLVSAFDSLRRVQISNQLSQEKANLALQKAKSQRVIFTLFAICAVLFLLSLLYIKLIRSSRKLKEQKTIIEHEKEMNESLLLNILPEKIAHELKEQGTVKPQYYDQVTVLFADFVDFSKITQKLTKEQLIKDINTLFSIFDELTDKYQLEKIKTIGDSYMCVSGLPDASTHSAKKVIQFSEEVLLELEIWNKSRTSIFHPHFDVRIGIHTGPVTAGVVGKKKFTYDIWGNTVNTASRMESNSDRNRINISESTLALVKDDYQVESRGAIAIRNLGEVNMYFIKN